MNSLRHRLAGCALLLVINSSIQAQSLQVSPVRLVMGQPAEFQLHIRPEGLTSPDEATQARHRRLERCLELHLSSGELALGPVDLAPHGSAELSEDETVSVRVRSRHPIPEPWLQGRAIWRCGARFVRDFMWLVDPPDPHSLPGQVLHAQTRQRTPDRRRPTAARPFKTAAIVHPPTQPLAHPEIARLLQTQQRLEASLSELEARLGQRNESVVANALPAEAPIRPPAGPPNNAMLGELGQGMLIGALVSSLLMGLGWRLGQRDRTLIRPEPPAATPTPPLNPSPTRERVTTVTPGKLTPAAAAHSAAAPAAERQTVGTTDEEAAPGVVVLDLPAHLPFELEQIDLTARQGFTGAAVAMIESALEQQCGGQLPAALLLRLVDHYRQLGRPVDLTRVSWPLERCCRVDPAQSGTSLIDDAGLSSRLAQLWLGPDRASGLARWLLRPPPQEDERTTTPEDEAPTLGLIAFQELLELYPLARAIDDDESGPDRPKLQGETLQRLDTAELSLAAPELQIRDELIR